MIHFNSPTKTKVMPTFSTRFLTTIKSKPKKWLCMLFVLVGHASIAQDAAVLPANNDIKVVWRTGGGSTFGTVTAVGVVGSWTDLALITNAGTSDFGYSSHSVSGFSAGTNITSTIKLSDGETYGTVPFTGYKVGVVANRAINGGTLPTVGLIGTNNVIITTWLGGIQQETYTQSWGAGAATIDASFYAHKPFDDVRVTLNGRVTNGSGTATATLGVNYVYLQRYTRNATCNAQIPLTGKALTATGSVLDLPLPLTAWIDLDKLEDEDPATSAYLGSLSFTGSLLTTYTVSVKDEAVVYPAGTFAGFNFTNGTGFTADALNTYSIKLYKGNNLIDEASGVGLLTAAILNTNGGTTLGVVATGEFDRVEYTSGTAISTPGVEVVRINYPVIQRFCDATIVCNTPTKLIKGVYPTTANYPVHAEATSLALLSLNATIKDLDRVVDSDPDNYAEISQLVSGASALGIRVVSEEKTANFPVKGYPAGYFAGFELEDVTLISGGAANRHIVETYLNGTATGDVYDDGGAVANAMFLASTGRYIVGMKTTKPFNEVRITIQSIGSAGVYATRVYAAVVEKFCPIADPTVCNVLTSLVRSTFPAYIDGRQTGTDGNSVATLNNYFENLNSITDADLNNYATLHTLASGSSTVSVAVQDGSKGVAPGFETYAGDTYFVGFDVSFPIVISGGFFNSITITTLDKDGIAVENITSSGSLAGLASSVTAGGIVRQTIGFLAHLPFTGVKFSATKAASVNWGEIRVYKAVIQKFCDGPALSCGKIDSISAPTHPLFINGKNTGIFAAFDGNSLITNPLNAIDADKDSYAELQLGTTALSQLGFSVANAKFTYPKQTYVGFDISTLDWVSTSALYQISIKLYNNGAPVQTSTSTTLGAGLTTDFGTGGFKRYVVGIVAYSEFDEAQIVYTRLAGSNVGEMRIHNFVVRQFKTADNTTPYCPTVLECGKSYTLTSGGTVGDKTLAAVVNFDNTGFNGAISGGYGLDNPWAVVSPAKTDFATIYNAANGATTGAISVAVPSVIFPKGSFAGFTVNKNPSFLAGGLFVGIRVRTLLNGVVQETKIDGALADFSLFVQWFGTPANFYTPGFKTTKPFNEVQISIGGLVSASDQQLDVYGAYVDTRESTPGTSGVDSSSALVCLTDLGNLSSTWSRASATIVATDRVWLGQDNGAPDANGANLNKNDGFTLTETGAPAGDVIGNGSIGLPYLISVSPGTDQFDFNITVNGNGNAKPVYWAVWFDANGNGNFTDVDDVFEQGVTEHGSPVLVTRTFTLLNGGTNGGAAGGNIRVAAAVAAPIDGYSKAQNGAVMLTNGEIEDYYVSYAVILPVTLSSFSGAAADCNARLTWVSATETNLKSYVVEYSANGTNNFVPVIEIAAKGNNQNYAYKHNDTKAISYYRLKQISTDGGITYSSVVKIVNPCIVGTITLWPNPVKNNTLRVTTSFDAGGAVVKVLNTTGQVINLPATHITNGLQINVSTLSAGSYVLQVMDKSGKVYMGKFIKY